MRHSAAPLLAALVGAVTAMVGCREMPSQDPPVLINPNMFDQERYNPESYSEFFADHRTMRTPPQGTIPAREGPVQRGRSNRKDDFFEDDQVQTGLASDNAGGYVMLIPPAAIDPGQTIEGRPGGWKELLDRGQERYGIYCVPCHGVTGDGKGMVAKVGGIMVPTYHDKRIREMPDGQLFNTITNGVRTMPSYAAQVPVIDRWAIVAYVRALQFSQLAPGEPKK